MMKFSVRQDWDPLKSCVIGLHYQPEFYSWIDDDEIRDYLEIAAYETEENFGNLIEHLNSFDVEIHQPRPLINTIVDNKHVCPPCFPRNSIEVTDNTVLFNSIFTFDFPEFYRNVREPFWPDCNTFSEFKNLPDNIKQECIDVHKLYEHISDYEKRFGSYSYIIDYINSFDVEIQPTDQALGRPYTSPCPGLVIASSENLDLKTQFPDCEIFYVSLTPTQVDEKINSFMQENFKHWFADRNKFNLGILPINDKNAIVDRHNDQLIQVLERHGVNVHLVEFTHRDLFALDVYSCTSELSREVK